MLPKVEAAIAFVNGRPEGKAVITSLENLGALIESESGTIIQKTNRKKLGKKTSILKLIVIKNKSIGKRFNKTLL